MGATYERAIHPKPRGMKAELVRFVLKSRAEMPEAQMSTSDMQINANSQKRLLLVGGMGLAQDSNACNCLRST